MEEGQGFEIVLNLEMVWAYIDGLKGFIDKFGSFQWLMKENAVINFFGYKVMKISLRYYKYEAFCQNLGFFS